MKSYNHDEMMRSFLLEAIEDIDIAPGTFIIERETFPDRFGNGVVIIPESAKKKENQATCMGQVIKCPTLDHEDPFTQQRVNCIKEGYTVSFYPTTPVSLGIEELNHLQVIHINDVLNWRKTDLIESIEKTENLKKRVNDHLSEKRKG